MNRISNFTSYNMGLAGILNGQTRMHEAQSQASSETIASDLKGFGADAKKLINARAIVAKVEARTDDLKSLQARATVEATAMTSFTDAVESVRQAIGVALANENGGGFRTAIESALSTAISAANVNFAGQSIFGGVRSYEEPLVGADLDTLAAQPNVDTNFVDTGPNRTVTLEDGRTIQISKNAEEVFKPFIELLREIRVFENANGAITGKLNATQVNFLKSKIPDITTLHGNATADEADSGLIAKEIDNSIEANDAKKTRLNEIVSDIQSVDLAEVAAKLSAAQTQYQASASIFAQLKDLNLLQFLR